MLSSHFFCSEVDGGRRRKRETSTLPRDLIRRPILRKPGATASRSAAVENLASSNSFNLLLVKGRFNFPRSAKEIEPVSSDTTIQRQFSTRSVIPIAAR